MQPEFTNSILVSSGTDCVIFDAWGTADQWVAVLKDNNLNLRAIYSTHGHYDHISAAPAVAEKYNVPWYMNHRDLVLVPWNNALLVQMGLPKIPNDYKQPLDLTDGEIEILPGFVANVIETPGHSAGGVVLHFPEQKFLIIGDTLFQETIGRYDLPGADAMALFQSISKIYNLNLPDDTVVIHGHGPDTTIGWLKSNNGFFKA